ncbi:MAG: cytochrome c oxidase subunit [Sphingomonadales bacterium]|jgi:cytochrome c oxidase subunit 2|nr:cytochrome c oxidase subunit [Sphingomonadales bacterium]
MKTPLKLILAAAAFALAPAAAFSQAAPAPAAAPAAPAPAAQAPRDSISAASQAAPAQPQEMNQPQGEAPSNASVLATSPARTAPNATVGQPTGAMGFQPQVTPIGEEALWFHNALLMPIITIISIFVLGLLLFVMIRFRRSANPVPSRTTHNTVLEVAWTLVPVLILVAIAVPSIRLLAHQYAPPKADITVKATGNQWYWTYTYPDHGGFEIVSNGIKDADAKARGEPRLLAVDERMVVPQGAVVKVIVTASDVIHSWGVPAFWVKLDAVPGRLNETWFKTDRPGVYYGQCFELCGARHAYMPIAVEVLPPAQFAAWVASKGGTMPGTAKPLPDSTAASPVTNPKPAPAAVGGSAPETSPEPTVTPGTTTPPVSSQGATNSRSGN